MVRFLIRMAIFLASAAIGLLIATILLGSSGFKINPASFVFVVVIFALLQALLAPVLSQAANRNAPALLGGVGLATTFIALLVTSLLASGLSISGLSTWVFATLIVWIVTMLATLFLPMIFVKQKLEDRRDANG